jgi:hypothetical protein
MRCTDCSDSIVSGPASDGTYHCDWCYGIFELYNDVDRMYRSAGFAGTEEVIINVKKLNRIGSLRDKANL